MDKPKKILAAMKKHSFKTNTKVVCVVVVFIFCMNMVVVLCPPFADFYRRYIFHYTSMLMAVIMGLFPFSVGEVMICLAILLSFLAIFIFLLGFLKIALLKKIRRYYFRGIVYILLYVYFTETFDCFMLYHAGTLKEEVIAINQKISSDDGVHNNIFDNRIDDSLLSPNDAPSTDIEKLLLVYNHVTNKINTLSLRMERDKNGDLLRHFTYEDCKEALHHISDYYPLLKGYYPNPKRIYYSDIMSQQYLEGIYFPFSMEVNYNQIMYCSNTPGVICHELSHLKGYIREDEANFIAYVACVNSDNEFLQYSGYLSVFYYLRHDLLEYGNDDISEQMERLNEYAYQDNIFLKEEDFEEIEKNAVISTETLSEATDTFLDTNLKMNGVSSGMDNYNEVVKLLILYYGLME